jgi:hypothetical protein
MSDRLTRYLDCIAACNACVVACNHCAASCLQEPDIKPMVRCVELDSDCAQICQLCVSLMAGGSELVPQVCGLCADACNACAAECSRHAMDHCQQCAEACQRCAAACKALRERVKG